MTKLRNITKKEAIALGSEDVDLVNTREVVVCADFGGFGLSREARNLFEEISGERFNKITTPRHHPALVHVVSSYNAKIIVKVLQILLSHRIVTVGIPSLQLLKQVR